MKNATSNFYIICPYLTVLLSPLWLFHGCRQSLLQTIGNIILRSMIINVNPNTSYFLDVYNEGSLCVFRHLKESPYVQRELELMIHCIHYQVSFSAGKKKWHYPIKVGKAAPVQSNKEKACYLLEIWSFYFSFTFTSSYANLLFWLHFGTGGQSCFF